MNQYKIEMKEIFRKEILVCAESEKKHRHCRKAY